MYGARDYLAYLGYGAMRLFQDDGAMATFGPGKKYLPVPYCHKYCTVPKVGRGWDDLGSVRLQRNSLQLAFMGGD